MEAVSKNRDRENGGPTDSATRFFQLTLVDADPERARELIDFFQGLGREVSWKTDAAQILSQSADPPTGAILLAVDKAKKGLEDCRLLRESGIVLPILFIGAGSPDQIFLREGLAAGIDDFLTWPLEPEDLILRLDIVHRRHQEIVRHRRHEDRLKTLEKALETLQLGVTITDIESRIQFINPADAHMHGYEIDELIGKDVRLLAPPRTWKPMAPADLRKARRWTRESINLRRDGSSFPVQLWSDVVTDSRGEPNRIVTICQDLTERRMAQAALHQKEEQMAAARGANDGLWSWNLETGFVDYSPRWKAMLGFGENEIAGQIDDWMQLVHAEDREGLEEDLQSHIKGETAYLENQHRMKHRDGRWLWMLCRGRAVRDNSGRALSLAGSHIDITALKEAEDALRKSELRFRSVAQSASDAIISTDDHDRIIFWNQSAEQLFGYTWLEIRSKSMETLMSPREHRKYQQSLDRLISDPQEDACPLELYALHRSGETFPVEVSLATWKVGERTFSSGIVRDIRERKAFESRLVELATHDSLTGLFNRRHLMETLSKFLASARRYRFPLTLCLCDLDHFKEINDRCGHQTGDQVLAEVGALIAETVRGSDLCCRYGGDEICILFPHSTIEESSRAIRRIQSGIERLSLADPKGVPLNIGISFGLAEMPSEDADKTAILQLADQALYKAKASKNGVESHSADHAWWMHPPFSDPGPLDAAGGSTGPTLLSEEAFRRDLAREIHDASRHGHPLSLVVLALRSEASAEKVFSTSDENLDRLLENRLSSLLRMDDLICRSSSEEFLVALPHTAERQVEHALNRLVQSILEVSREIPGTTEAWFGVALLSDRVQTAEDLLGEARRSLRAFPTHKETSVIETPRSEEPPAPPA